VTALYSRYHNRTDEPLRIPENYSGYAFSGGSARQEIPPRQIDVAKPTPAPQKSNQNPVPTSDRATETPPKDDARAECPKTPSEAMKAPCEHLHQKDEKPQEEKPTSLSEPLLPRLGGAGFPFGHGIGFDEMLLLGLIVLLHGSEQGSDVILWLILLLFMG
jgi:hypothetical protein